ncbi:porin family protein [Dyadobacter sp. CY312]|uniref:porin family protein n=1 Tax=Dyadobacter sp. CY312 TaxID=2907303 RepID=UPI001F434BD8|nr:porin family protein [Dyadobacter sp. CY312]MCE7038852.1 PorT family protein [Dyadobacter sp. CY312]
MIKLYKTLFIYLPLTFATFNYADAQVQYGFRIGGNASRFNLESDETEVTNSYKPKLNFAVLFNLPLGKSLSLQIEPGFTQLGGGHETEYTEEINNHVYKHVGEANTYLSYLELPVLFQYSYKIGKIETLFSLGPEVRLLTKPMRSKYTGYEYIDNILDAESSINAMSGGSEGIKKVDYGLAAGIGIGIMVKNIKLFGECRYHQGFADIIAPLDEDFKIRNSYGSVNFGVLIPLKSID